MVRRAMRDRWTSHGIEFCFVFIFVVMEIHGCWSLNSEGLALLKFREKVDSDPFGAFANWKPEDSDPCMWSGVGCVDGKVHALNLRGQDLQGSLAPEIGSLTHLRALDLSKNQFSGTIPPELGQLTALEVLDLRNNELTGVIPAELRGLSSLKLVLLRNNRFGEGTPVEIRKHNLLTDLPFDKIITPADTGIGCLNRRFGRWFKFGSEASSIKVGNSYATVKDIKINTNNQGNMMRRILAEGSSNIPVVPANTPPVPVIALPSRSSGSFPATPHKKKLSPAPAPSVSMTMQHKPRDPGAWNHRAYVVPAVHMVQLFI